MSVDFLPRLTGCFSTPCAGNPTVAMVEAAYRHHGFDARYLNCEVPPAQTSATPCAGPAPWAGSASTARCPTRSR